MTYLELLVETHETMERYKEQDLHHPWALAWRDRYKRLLAKLPSGSGINGGTEIVSISAQKLVLTCGFHHMHDNGMYGRWTTHKITVTPLLTGPNIHVGGINYNGIKDYLYDTFACCLLCEVDQDGNPVADKAPDEQLTA